MSSPNIQRQGAPRGGSPMRGAPRGSPRGAPRGGMYRGGPPRGGPPRGRGNFGGNNVVREAPPSTGPTRTEIKVEGQSRHSKIELDGENSLATKGLDIEGLSITKKNYDDFPRPSNNYSSSNNNNNSNSSSVHSESSPVLSSGGAKGGIGNLWAQKMAQQEEDNFQKNRDKLRGRRKGGVEFMDTQIRSLIDEIKRLGSAGPPGLASVKYGVLFSATIDSMPALSATLQCAKKREVLKYEGTMLMQGVNDNTIITLLKDEIDDTPDFQSVVGIRPVKPITNEPVFTQSGCVNCNKTVYPMDRLAANGKVMHKSCFRCCECQKVLNLSAYAYNGGKFYCETHFQQKFKAGSGYNF